MIGNKSFGRYLKGTIIWKETKKLGHTLHLFSLKPTFRYSFRYLN